MTPSSEPRLDLDLVLGQYRDARHGGMDLDDEDVAVPQSVSPVQSPLPIASTEVSDPVEAVLRQTRGAREANDGSLGASAGGAGTNEDFAAM